GLLRAVREIGAIVLVDDLEFGGAALDAFLDATPECALLVATTPDVPAPSPDCHLEEVFLSGLSRTGVLELLEREVGRPLGDDEAHWAADLWFESDGLPLRFVQAGALLRQRDAGHTGAPAFDTYGNYAGPDANYAGPDAPSPYGTDGGQGDPVGSSGHGVPLP